MKAVKTRFAPSPTGFLHIGGARTALFNWAYARRHGGNFVLRIEDTDRERSTLASEQEVLQGLEWLGLHWDEGPYRQSERREHYAAVVEELLRKDRAYRCTCTREELEERKQAVIARGQKWTYDGRCRNAAHGVNAGPHTVRLRVPEDAALTWEDGVFGPSGQAASEIGDMIIRRSDGLPLYHLAVVVDDIDMGITHVIRGADHHSNTPFQLALYRALEAPPPRFVHVPLIVGAGGKKLSKRFDDVSVNSFRTQGDLACAMRNWLARIGWSHGDQEIFSAEEIARLFNLENVNRASAQADPGKLLWLNQHYIKTLPMQELFAALQPFLEHEAGRAIECTPELTRLLDLLRERSKTLLEMAQLARFLVVDELGYDEKAAKKFLRPEVVASLQQLHDELEKLVQWDETALKAAFEHVLAALEKDAAAEKPSLGKLAQPVRVAVTGGTVSPGIFETLAVLGRERSLARLAEAIHFIRHG